MFGENSNLTSCALDGTILTKDGKVSAHFEHDVCITKSAPDVLSSFEEIEAAERANQNLTWSYSD